MTDLLHLFNLPCQGRWFFGHGGIVLYVSRLVNARSLWPITFLAVVKASKLRLFVLCISIIFFLILADLHQASTLSVAHSLAVDINSLVCIGIAIITPSTALHLLFFVFNIRLP